MPDGDTGANHGIDAATSDRKGPVRPASDWSKPSLGVKLSYAVPSFATAAMAAPVIIELKIFYTDTVLVPAGLLAVAFHATVGETTVELAATACREHGIDRVALGGGVFQNSLLLAIVVRGLEERDLDVLLAERLGPNDGCISYGQAVVAAARLADEQGR